MTRHSTCVWTLPVSQTQVAPHRRSTKQLEMAFEGRDGEAICRFFFGPVEDQFGRYVNSFKPEARFVKQMSRTNVSSCDVGGSGRGRLCPKITLAVLPR